MLFAGTDYYPRGGWGDYKGHYSSFENAEAAIKALVTEDSPDAYRDGMPYAWAHVVYGNRIAAAWRYAKGSGWVETTG